MEKSNFEKQTPWQEDISKIKEQIGFKEGQAFEAQQRKELIKQALSQELEPVKQVRPEETPKTTIPQDKTEVLNYAISTAKNEGIVKAYKIILKAKDPWLIDEFHDLIIEEIEKEIFPTKNPA